MDAPTVDQLQARSAFLADRVDAELTPLAEEGAALVSSLTGRDIGVSALGGGDSPTGCPWEDVPGWLRPSAERAVAFMVESLIGVTSATRAAKRGDRQLASFSAGPYSESYFSPEQVSKSQTLHPDPMVHQVLWSIATECARQYWLRLWGVETAVAPAAVAVQTVPRIGWTDRPPY